MIKKFKNGSHKISIATALCCAMVATAVFTNGITVNGMDGSDAQGTSMAVSNSGKHTFLIDSQLKHYDIKKAEEIVGFKFKLPGYLPNGYNESLDADVVRLGDNNAFETDINFQLGQDKKKNDSLSFKAFKGEPAESLKQIYINTYSDKANVKVKETSMSTKKLNGVSLDVTEDYNGKDYGSADLTLQQKYFTWKNDGIWYALEYKATVIANGKTQDRFSIPISDISDIAASIVYPEEQKNVKYADKQELSTELGIMDIYDKDDIKKAENLIGFNLKFPLKIDNDINITCSNVGISSDSDVKNNKIYYELLNFYPFKGGSITFSQSKSPAELKTYDDMKKNGYTVEEDWKSKKDIKIKSEELTIDNKAVMKYEDSIADGSTNYVWKENDVIYLVTIFGKLDNADEAAKEFVMSNGVK